MNDKSIWNIKHYETTIGHKDRTLIKIEHIELVELFEGDVTIFGDVTLAISNLVSTPGETRGGRRQVLPFPRNRRKPVPWKVRANLERPNEAMVSKRPQNYGLQPT